MSPRLCLGTAQFGLDYGITNKIGKLKINEINSILHAAKKEGINYIDTAQAYGNAEVLLGDAYPIENNFKLINKFSLLGKRSLEKNVIYELEENLNNSLQNLRISQIDSFLLHDHNDLLIEESYKLIDWMISLKARSIVKRIGISIYNLEDLDQIPIETFDVFQVPLSLYDQRFKNSGVINNLKKMGKAIHVRSIFLQGLILDSPSNWPDYFSEVFRSHHKFIYESVSQKNMNMLEATLSFLFNCSEIECILFGVTSISEFNQILSTWKSCKNISKKFNDLKLDFAFDKTNETDPRFWESLKTSKS